MKIEAKEIPLFKDFSEHNFGLSNYDFHNDYDCVGIESKDLRIRIRMKGIATGNLISLDFYDAEIVFLDLIFEEQNTLTMDSLYRGRYENKGGLVEFSGQKGFFYLEFTEGGKLEFWANSISLSEEGL